MTPPRRTAGHDASSAAAELAGRQRHELTRSVEDYLKAAYELEREEEVAATTALAARLGVSPASVTGMVRRLAELGLLAHERYRGARLTAAGRREALRTLRRHRVIEAYLVRALGYAWDEVHAEAERLEHAVTDELIDRMAAAIGEPTVDPHGAPIPSREGAVDEAPYPTLTDTEPGCIVEITRVADEDSSLLRELAALALRPGCRVRVLEVGEAGGPIQLRLGERCVSIGRAIAERILVRHDPG